MVDEFTRRTRQMREDLVLPWDSRRTAGAVAEVHRRHARQQVLRVARLLAVGTVACVAVYLLQSSSPDRDSQRRFAAAPASTESSVHMPSRAAEEQPIGPVQPALKLSFCEGSRWRAANQQTLLTVLKDTPAAVTLRLERGMGRVEASHRPGRRFTVHVGDVRVSVVGTVFTLRKAQHRAWVSVSRGTVRVSWATKQVLLTAGEQRWFGESEAVAVGGVASAPEDQRSHLAEAPRLARRSATHRSRPRGSTARGIGRGRSPDGRGSAHLQPGGSNAPRSASRSQPTRDAVTQRMTHAQLEALAAGGSAGAGSAPLPLGLSSPTGVVAAAPERRAHRERPAAPQTPHALLQAADRARSSEQPERASVLLRRFVEDYNDDPRAPLAAFTLGRVLMRLERPRQAAKAFLRTRALAPTGSLAEDALAREVEAWHVAGEPGRARKRAREYLRRYPQGRRTQWVRKYSD